MPSEPFRVETSVEPKRLVRSYHSKDGLFLHIPSPLSIRHLLSRFGLEHRDIARAPHKVVMASLYIP